MSKLVGRRSVELNINSLQSNVIPIYNGTNKIWSTVTTASLLSGSVSLSGSNTLIGDQTISGSLTVVNGITGSLFGTASSLPYEVWKYGGNDFGLVGGPNRILGTLSDHDLVIYTSGSQRATFTKGGNFVLGDGLPDIVAAEKILIDAGETTSYNLIKGRGSADSYLQFNIQNQSTGHTASTDIAATADNGTESTIYVDMGINGSGFVHNPDYSVGYANDTYLLSVANDHWIGSPVSGKITLFTGDNFDGEAHAKLILRPTNNHEISGSLNISGSLIAQSFTGSLLGTASYASFANTSSYAITSSLAINANNAVNATTASYVENAQTASYVTTAQTASYVLQAQSASYWSGSIINAATASYVQNAQTASYVLQAVSASYWSGSIINAATASYVENAQTASYVLNAVTASHALYSNQALSSSYAATASSADNFTVRGTLTAQTIVAQTITSSIEYVTGSTQFGSLLTNTHQFTGSVSISGSLSLNGNNVITSDQTSSLSASYAETASYALNSNLLDGKDSTIFATTGSNTFTSNQVISGSLSIVGNHNINAGNTNYIHGIGIENNGDETNQFITLLYTETNTSLTSSVEVSGNSTQLYVRSGSDTNQFILYPTYASLDKRLEAPSFTGSLLGTASYATQALSASYWSGSVTNAATASYVLQSVSASFASTASSVNALNQNVVVSGSLTISGSTNIIGNSGTTLLSSNADTLVFTGSLLTSGSIISNGSLNVLGGITGSLLGTASYASQALSASYWSGSIINASSASYAETASNAPNYLPLAGGTLTGDLYAAGRTFWYQDLILGYGTTGGKITTDGTKYISIMPDYNVESVRFWPNGNVTIQNAGTYVDNGFRLDVSGSGRFTDGLTITGSLNVTNGITGSLLGTASYTSQALSSSYASTSSYADNFTVKGTLTAQTINVQTITSSIDFITGSSINGTLLSDTHQFTGSVNITGSLGVNGSNVILTNQTSSMSVLSASYATTASYIENAQTASYVLQAQSASYWSGSIINAATASYVENAQTASYVLQAVSASYSQTSSYAIQAITSSYANTSEWNGLNNKPISSSLGSALAISTTVVASAATSSYSAAFFDYAVVSGSNLRAGTIMTVWNGSSIEYAETSTKDIGNTSQVTMSADLSSGNIRLKATTTDAWTVKSLIRLI